MQFKPKLSIPRTSPPPETQGRLSLDKPRRKHIMLKVVIGVIVLACLLGAGVVVWYRQALQPKDPQQSQKISITVSPGETAEVISKNLEKKGVIASSMAFQIYAHLAKVKHELQAGVYSLSPSQSVEQIVDKLTTGDTDRFMVTILPGSTLKDIKKSFIGIGFTAEEVDKALSMNYKHLLLVGKPAGTTLEGYIFPDTYEMRADETLESLIVRSFDAFYGHLQDKRLIEQFKARKITLYKAMTLASIIQKEVVGEEDARQVAQVFYKRLVENMRLGADATFIYAAELLGVEPRVTLDSPYNTRMVTGLPPGPIANMTISMLEAVAKPAKGDYLYFVSGDDGTTYFSRTEAEHEAKAKLYCIENCAIFNN